MKTRAFGIDVNFWACSIAAAILLLLTEAMPAMASQSEIDIISLGISSFGFTLTGEGQAGMTLSTETCNSTGCILASGPASTYSESETYTFWSTDPHIANLNLIPDGQLQFVQLEPIYFSFSSSQGSLTGTLGLNYSLLSDTGHFAATIIITGGSLAEYVGNNGGLQAAITLELPGDPYSLLGTTNSMSGNFEKVTAYAPEPGSMVLFGSGLIGVVGMWRRRVRFR